MISVGRIFGVGFGEVDRNRVEAIEEKLAVRQAGEIVMHRVVQAAAPRRFFSSVMSVMRADDAQYFAVGSRPRDGRFSENHMK
jgi:hypothetical protein